jgi:uncharacterized lipoprotein
MKVQILSLLLIVSATLNACSLTPQTATLRPTLSVPQSDIGQKRNVSVQILDERPNQSLGRRGAAGMRGAEIKTDQNVAELISTSVNEGLAQIGFTPEPYDPKNPRLLRIEVRQLEYSTSQGMWSGAVRTNAALKAIARNQGLTYENFYRAANDKRTFFVPGASKNEEMLNQTLSSVIDQIFQDQALLSFLAKG